MAEPTQEEYLQHAAAWMNRVADILEQRCGQTEDGHYTRQAIDTYSQTPGESWYSSAQADMREGNAPFGEVFTHKDYYTKYIREIDAPKRLRDTAEQMNAVSQGQASVESLNNPIVIESIEILRALCNTRLSPLTINAIKAQYKISQEVNDSAITMGLVQTREHLDQQLGSMGNAAWVPDFIIGFSGIEEHRFRAQEQARDSDVQSHPIAQWVDANPEAASRLYETLRAVYQMRKDADAGGQKDGVEEITQPLITIAHSINLPRVKNKDKTLERIQGLMAELDSNPDAMRQLRAQLTLACGMTQAMCIQLDQEDRRADYATPQDAAAFMDMLVHEKEAIKQYSSSTAKTGNSFA